MIGIIRVRFTATDISKMWSDSQFHSLMDRTIEYSLAHYWHKATFGQADLRYELFPPITLDDPRNKLPLNANNVQKRQALVNAATDKISDDFGSNWKAFDMLLIWFAQQTDLFGTPKGGYPVPVGFLNLGSKILPVAVCDITSPFDAICHEFGHALGFEHSHGIANTLEYLSEYGDPYDIMSAMNYGGFRSTFIRPENALLPEGTLTDNLMPMTRVGPLLSAAQLYNSRFTFPNLAFRFSGLFITVPESYTQAAFTFTINALDFAVDSWSSQVLPILAILKSDVQNGNIYFLELRRSSGYDSGLRKQDFELGPPIGIVIHTLNQVTNRLEYVDTFSFGGNRGDTDYHSFGGHFTFRVNSLTTDFRSVNITVGGADFWRNFGISFEKIEHKIISTRISDWQKVQVSPCFLYPVGEYSVRYKLTETVHIYIVSSFGYEIPVYIWSIDEQKLDPEKKSVTILVATENSPFTLVDVTIDYSIQDNSITIKCDPQIGNFSVNLYVTVVETSPEVIKNYYDHKNISTRLNFDNAELFGGDEEFEEKRQNCTKEIQRVDDLTRRVTEAPIVTVPVPDPSPFNLPQTEELIRELIDENPAIANIIIEKVSKMTHISKLNILKKL